MRRAPARAKDPATRRKRAIVWSGGGRPAGYVLALPIDPDGLHAGVAARRRRRRADRPRRTSVACGGVPSAAQEHSNAAAAGFCAPISLLTRTVPVKPARSALRCCNGFQPLVSTAMCDPRSRRPPIVGLTPGSGTTKSSTISTAVSSKRFDVGLFGRHAVRRDERSHRFVDRKVPVALRVSSVVDAVDLVGERSDRAAALGFRTRFQKP